LAESTKLMNLPVLPKYQITSAFRKRKILRAEVSRMHRPFPAADSWFSLH
jgi:hypothetical protein